MASGIMDALTFSSVPNGVGAAGTANAYIGMFLHFPCHDTVITQNIGAGKPGDDLVAAKATHKQVSRSAFGIFLYSRRAF